MLIGIVKKHVIMMIDGAPLAVMESSYLTALRIGLAGALGADVPARPDAGIVAIVDAGAQHAQFAALRRVRPVAAVRIFTPVLDAAKRLAAAPASQDLDIVLARDLDEALDGADIVVITATWAEEPFILRRHLRRGLHITTLGPDQPGKCEVAAEALLAARVVVDDRALAVTMGAVGNAGLSADAIHAETWRDPRWG